MCIFFGKQKKTTSVVTVQCSDVVDSQYKNIYLLLVARNGMFSFSFWSSLFESGLCLLFSPFLVLKVVISAILCKILITLEAPCKIILNKKSNSQCHSCLPTTCDRHNELGVFWQGAKQSVL